VHRVVLFLRGSRVVELEVGGRGGQVARGAVTGGRIDLGRRAENRAESVELDLPEDERLLEGSIPAPDLLELLIDDQERKGRSSEKSPRAENVDNRAKKVEEGRTKWLTSPRFRGHP